MGPLRWPGRAERGGGGADLLSREDDDITGQASSSQGPPARLPFHGPNSPASQETFPDEEDPEFLTTDEEVVEEEECGGEQCQNDGEQEQGGESAPNSAGTIGWTEVIDIIPGHGRGKADAGTVGR